MKRAKQVRFMALVWGPTVAMAAFGLFSSYWWLSPVVGASLLLVSYTVSVGVLLEFLELLRRDWVYLPAAYVAVLVLLGAFGAIFAMAAFETATSETISCMFDQNDGTNLAYFVAVTMTTLGYGDCVPVTAVAKYVAAVLAILGSVHTVVFFAVLAAHIPGSMRRS